MQHHLALVPEVAIPMHAFLDLHNLQFGIGRCILCFQSCLLSAFVLLRRRAETESMRHMTLIDKRLLVGQTAEPHYVESLSTSNDANVAAALQVSPSRQVNLETSTNLNFEMRQKYFISYNKLLECHANYKVASHVLAGLQEVQEWDNDVLKIAPM